MSSAKQIKKALISVYSKENLDSFVKKLHELGVEIISTGGTQSYIESLSIPVTAVENLTDYPSIFGGRVKTLHPKIFGGILNRRSNQEDVKQANEFNIQHIDLVIVDLYPFENTVASGALHEDIIEKIDIGGISLIRAAAKNYQDVVIIPSKNEYAYLQNLLNENGANTTLENRKYLAAQAFNVSSHYDSAIFSYFDPKHELAFKLSAQKVNVLRYGENPHQKGIFAGNLEELFTKVNGKELSYNNLLDVDAAVNLMADFTNEKPTFAILKHNNACGMSTRETILEAWNDALAADPVSAFGGILISNTTIDELTALEINKLFFEVVIAPNYDLKAQEILSSKKNRIVLIQKPCEFKNTTVRTCLNGFLVQDKDERTETEKDFTLATELPVQPEKINDLIFANKLVKHTKSNTIVLVKNQQLLASGTGQTSRVDALRQAIHKAKSFGFDLNGSVMASDAFFPFADCVEIANLEGINTVIQPGGSIKDQDSINYCNQHKMAMVFTGTRHFKH